MTFVYRKRSLTDWYGARRVLSASDLIRAIRRGCSITEEMRRGVNRRRGRPTKTFRHLSFALAIEERLNEFILLERRRAKDEGIPWDKWAAESAFANHLRLGIGAEQLRRAIRNTKRAHGI
jgi:hypothetical protein